MPNLGLGKLWRKKSANISQKDPTYKVIYLGNVVTGWAKGEGCVDKPLSSLWRNYFQGCQSNKNSILMKLTICGSGLNAVTREHGVTEYWAHRVTYCGTHPGYPKVFCWIYRHESRRFKQELRCHAVLCPRSDKAQMMATQLKDRLSQALHEFRREKVIRQNARLSLMHAIYDNASLPTRKLLLSTGATNYRPPLERSKSAPKLGSIEETIEEDEEDEFSPIEEEDNDEELKARAAESVKCSPVGSLISETRSDIVLYNNSSDAVALVYPSAKDTSSQNNRLNEHTPQDKSQLLKTVSSNVSSINSNTLIFKNNSSRKLMPSIKTPVMQRRLIRSVTIDTPFDTANDSEEEDYTEETCIIRSQDLRLIDITSFGGHHHRDSDAESFTSTDTTDTVLDRPHTVEDALGLFRDLSLTRQLSLPNDTSHVPGESSHVPGESSRVPQESSRVPQESSRIPEESSHVTQESSHAPEESLTSDQPESLGSHSCNSSCGGCSDAGGHHNTEDLEDTSSSTVVTDTAIHLLHEEDNIEENYEGMKRRSKGGGGGEEEEPDDNISEESGYAEEKDFHQPNTEQLTKMIVTASVVST